MVALVLGLSTAAVTAGFRFVVWGDTTDYLDYVATNAAQIRSLPVQPKLSLLAGDLHRYGFTADLGDARRMAMDGDAVGPSGLFETMFPVRGNHDLAGGDIGTSNWQAYYAISNRVDLIGGSNYTCMPGYDSLTYSFDYQGCHFVGMDIPGDVTLVQSNQVDWLDADLSAAEARSLRHAFLWWHGPVYACGSRHGGIDAPPYLFAALNRHPSVSAVFGGHAHVFAWAHMYTNRIPELTNPFEAFIVPPVAEDLAFLDDTNRVEFGVPLVRGFVTVDVDGPEFTVSLHVQDEPGARWSRTFPASGQLTSAAFQTPGEFTCTVVGDPGHRYQIESTTSYQEWVAIGSTNVESWAAVPFKDPQAGDASRRFYRAVLVVPPPSQH